MSPFQEIRRGWLAAPWAVGDGMRPDDDSQKLPPLPRRRALDHPIRPTRAEISLVALRHNLAAARHIADRAEVLAVVKANAYGHGAVPVSRALEAEGVRFLAVALVEEGIELRNAGVRTPILVLGGSYEGGYHQLVQQNLIPTVFRVDHLEQLSRAARTAGRSVKAHLKVDTGMGRIGVLATDLPAFLEQAKNFANVELDGLLSHFANADLADSALTQEQISRFKSALAAMREHGYSPSYRHLSNSAGVLALPEVRDGLELNMVRPGLMLYGLVPSPWLGHSVELAPVLTWKTGIIHLKRVPAGTPISYGSTWVAPRESVIATLPIGYADGYSRMYSSHASVLIRGQRARVIGRVCMDMSMVDVTDIPDAQMHDEVVILGAQGQERITADELATLSQTINYEVLCALGARVPRVVTQS